MMFKFKLLGCFFILIGGYNFPIFAQATKQASNSDGSFTALLIFAFIIVLIALFSALYLYQKIISLKEIARKQKGEFNFREYIKTFNSNQIDTYLKIIKDKGKFFLLFFVIILLASQPAFSQGDRPAVPLMSHGGIIITLFLILIPILALIVILIVKINAALRSYQNKRNLTEADYLTAYLREANQDEIEQALLERKKALDYSLSNQELAGSETAEDSKGLLHQINTEAALPVVALKKRAQVRPGVDQELSKLIIWLIGTATFWLLFGTSVGEYLGIKFVAPDLDHQSWLSFGRLRPVHTNSVFWGWASLGMLGLGYYIVPRVGNTTLYSLKLGWYTLILINAAVVLGTLSLLAGINNGGGEYREYIWPIQLLFGIGLVLTLINFFITVGKRTTTEIYISNWYIISAVIFAIVITIVAYLPNWQNGLGETIVQGYYMHQGVGMWFMLFTLGIVYYFLPQQLNKPIYSYSLGILAFWTQILFYTVIGTHHFVFSSIPWWLQTTAIVGSAGMIIPVAAGSANFLLTFKGAWYKVSSSYTLPFFLVGTIFYFTGSLQGTAEAFRSTNLIWHFTDFTVAHSHITMYGIINFFLWAGIYALIPRLTGKEAPQITVGAHFWLALIGLLFYTIPLMYGSTLRGLMWMDGKPFIDSVVFMAPYWLWRAIGGSLMWIAHLFFAYNIYRMLVNVETVDVSEAAVEKLNQSYSDSDTKF